MQIAEADENQVREDFTPSEAVAVAKYFKAEERAKAKARQGTRTDKHPRKFRTSEKARAVDALAARVGMSGRTLEKAESSTKVAQTLNIHHTAKNKELGFTLTPLFAMVRERGVEPLWVSPLDPKSSASASSATLARLE